MKRSKSGAQKRKEAATARDAVAKLPKMTDFFKITEQSRPGASGVARGGRRGRRGRSAPGGTHGGGIFRKVKKNRTNINKNEHRTIFTQI